MNMENECPNCGNKMSSREECCKYCGTKNPYYQPPEKPYVPPFQNYNSTNSKGGVNGVILILLILLFWPAAIIYAIVASRK